MRQFMLCAFLAAALPMAGWAAEAPPMVAYIGEMSGSVEMQAAGSEVWNRVKLGEALPGGARLKTQRDSGVTVAFTDGSKLRIGPMATFTMEQAANSKVSVFVGLGKLEAWVKKFAGRTFSVRSPSMTAAVRGTVFVMAVMSPTMATLDCFEGSLAVTDNFGNTAAVGGGQRLEASATSGASAPAPVPPTAKAPVEPKVTVAPPPPPAAAPAAPKAPAAKAPPPPPPDTVVVESSLPPPPPPPPAQEDSVAPSCDPNETSPSSPNYCD